MPNTTRRPSHSRVVSTPPVFRPGNNERQPLLRRRSYDEYEGAVEEDVPTIPLAGGTVLGIHNLAIVMPQFIVSYRFPSFLHTAEYVTSGCFGHQRNIQDCRWFRLRLHRVYIFGQEWCWLGPTIWWMLYAYRGDHSSHGSTYANRESHATQAWRDATA